MNTNLLTTAATIASILGLTFETMSDDDYTMIIRLAVQYQGKL
jgi:hypothetical protein